MSGAAALRRVHRGPCRLGAPGGVTTLGTAAPVAVRLGGTRLGRREMVEDRGGLTGRGLAGAAAAGRRPLVAGLLSLKTKLR